MMNHSLEKNSHADTDYQAFLKRMINSPWEFAKECVYTQDQVDQSNPIKAFPIQYEYLHLYFKVWQRYRFIAVPKSRRMFMSWANIVLYLWDTMTHVGRHNAFVSKKEEDADDLIKRAKFIYDHIPESVWPKDLKPEAHYKYCTLEFPQLKSKIQGFPQGSDQLRAYTFSGILADEAGFWEKAQEMYSASMPTLEGGGRMTMISSPAPGFFKRLVFDQLDESKTTTRLNYSSPIPGVELWVNEGNKFLVYQLHYSADPKKTDPTYREKIKATMPSQQYMQEYELQWDSYEGKPVYPDFSKRVHGSEKELLPEIGLPLLIGMDFGLTPAAVICQVQEDTLVVFEEMTAMNMGVDKFSERLIRHLRQNYTPWNNFKRDIKLFVDPSGYFRKDTDENTCAKILQDKGFVTTPGPVTWEERRTGVEKWLMRMTKKGPCFQLNLGKAPMLTRGFEGGYRYPDSSFDLEPSKIRPIKDEHSHVHDALQYVASGISKLQNRRQIKIPKPEYAWSRR